MKTRLSLIPALTLGVLVAVLAAGRAAPAHAGPYTDQLSQCLMDSTTEQDKSNLVRWVFASTAQHPDVAAYATVPPEERAALSRSVSTLFERLLTQDCRTQFREARKNDGEETVSTSFGILVQTALRGLIENPSVSSALVGVDDHLDKQKIAGAMADAR